jgi:hypothetical protein
MIVFLTVGVRRCQLATSSRNASSFRHTSDTPRGQFSQVMCGDDLVSDGPRVQFPPPPFLVSQVIPSSLAHGADPGKLARQIAKHGRSLDGMPPLQVIRGKDGHLRIDDGVTRAAKLRPGVLVPAEVIQDLPRLDVTRMPCMSEVTNIIHAIEAGDPHAAAQLLPLRPVWP